MGVGPRCVGSGGHEAVQTSVTMYLVGWPGENLLGQSARCGKRYTASETAMILKGCTVLPEVLRERWRFVALGPAAVVLPIDGRMGCQSAGGG